MAQPANFSFDFAEKVPHISEEIFSYLEVKDLLVCSLVSKEWHKLIGTKPELMAKIKIKLDRNSEPEEEKKVLLSSSRKYQNIEIFYANIDQFHVELFKKSEGLWKSVVLKNCRFEYEKALHRIMKSVEPKIEELSIDDSSIVSNTRLLWDETLSFKKLKTLKITADDIPLSFFRRCKSLMCFDVDVKYLAEVNDIRQILQLNAELKNVKIYQSRARRVFDDALWRKVTFHFDVLHVKFGSAPPPFMAQFLETQIESLTSLGIDAGMELESLEVIFRMRKLKELRIFVSWDGWLLQWDDLELPKNSSIESLELCYWRGQAVNNIKVFVQAMPNVKHLKIWKLTDEVFTFLSTNARILESVECGYFEVSSALVLPADPLPNLKILKILHHYYNAADLQRLRTALNSAVSVFVKGKPA